MEEIRDKLITNEGDGGKMDKWDEWRVSFGH